MLITKARSGASRIDTIVVAASSILSIALLAPAVQGAREAARKTECKNHLMQLALAMQNYHNTNAVFPNGISEGRLDHGVKPSLRAANRNVPGWILLLPYLDLPNLGRQWDIAASSNRPGDDRATLKLATTIIPILLCPSDGEGLLHYEYKGNDPKYQVSPNNEIKPAATNYLFAAGSLTEASPAYRLMQHVTNSLPNGRVVNSVGIFGSDGSARVKDITDGTSNTIMIGESVRFKESPEYTPLWGAGKYAGLFGRVDPHKDPNDINNCIYRINKRAVQCDPKLNGRPYAWTWSGFHSGGVQFAFADGSVHFVGEDIDWVVFCLMNFVADGQPGLLNGR
jgi:prepilin-type processing-associated H-X9-DG protein